MPGKPSRGIVAIRPEGHRLPLKDTGAGSSMLAPDTYDRQQRQDEQYGHQTFGTVHAKEHANPQATSGLDNVQSNAKQHPLLDTPALDGADKNVSPLPTVNPQGIIEFEENALREQLKKQLELQEKLQNQNQQRFSTAPKPSGP